MTTETYVVLVLAVWLTCGAIWGLLRTLDNMAEF